MRIAIALAWIWFAAGTPLAAGPPVAGPGHLEVRDDDPAPVTRDLQSRTVAATVVRDGFVSVQVNVDAQGFNIVGDAANEPSLAIDPNDPSRIVIGWRQFDSVSSNFRQAGVGYSHDGGTTWTFPGVLEPGQFRSDPVLAVDSSGRFFYYSLSSTTSAEMFYSDDAGVTWAGPTPAFGGDKTWIAADDTGGVGDGNVYLIWDSVFTCCAGGTDFSRTVDGGQTYGGPFRSTDKSKWGTVAVGPDGAVHVVGTRGWVGAYPVEHLFMTSLDARDGTADPTWEPTVDLHLGGAAALDDTPNPVGLLGQVWVAVDRSGGPTDGNVYVLASVDPAGDDPLDVHFVRSTDGGASFTAPRRVHRDVPDTWQWFGTMSVAPDGRIDVVWNDTRSDPSGRISEVYYAYSRDAGETWSRGIPVTPPFNSTRGHPQQAKIGDYYHMVSGATGGALAYAATFNDEQDIWFLRVGDCNANGVHDGDDIEAASSVDCDFDGVPDECQDIVVCLGCDDDGTCDRGENCASCPGDCATGILGCGNGVCEPSIGEDCVACPADCAGVQAGKPNEQYCCGDGDGTRPIDCTDVRCGSAGFACSDLRVPGSCCGDDVCEGTEDAEACRADCGVGTPGEASDPADPGDQLRVTAYDPIADLVEIAFAPACDATEHTVYAGALEEVSSYTYDDATCNLGTTGSASFVAGAGDRFFVVVGNDTTREGSYGADGDGVQRPEDVGTAGCDLPQDLASVTCP